MSKRLPFSNVMMADVRYRLSLSLCDVHTSHLQPICGTPVLVPVPQNVRVGIFFLQTLRTIVKKNLSILIDYELAMPYALHY